MGKPLQQETADLVDTAMRKLANPAKEKELMEKILRPENCTGLIVPCTNPEAWREMREIYTGFRPSLAESASYGAQGTGASGGGYG